METHDVRDLRELESRPFHANMGGRLSALIIRAQQLRMDAEREVWALLHLEMGAGEPIFPSRPYYADMGGRITCPDYPGAAATNGC